MTAYIFTGGNSPEPQKINLFLKNNPPDKIIAADSGLEAFNSFRSFFNPSFNLKLDSVCGDFDSLKNKSLLDEINENQITRFPAYKDFTDTELALKEAWETGSDRIILIGGSGGRADHFISVYNTFSQEFFPHVWITEKEIIYLLESGKTAFIKNLTLNDNISISRLPGHWNDCEFESEGLEWEYDKFRKCGMPSLSNVISEKFLAENKPVKLSVRNGSCLLFLPFDAVPEIC